MESRPALPGLVLALLPAAIAFAEVVRGTRSTSAWHPLAVLAFAWMVGTIAWWCWREWKSQITSGTTSLLAIGLFMVGSLALHPILFALLTGGWGISYKLDLDPDLLYYG